MSAGLPGFVLALRPNTRVCSRATGHKGRLAELAACGVLPAKRPGKGASGPRASLLSSGQQWGDGAISGRGLNSTAQAGHGAGDRPVRALGKATSGCPSHLRVHTVPCCFPSSSPTACKSVVSLETGDRNRPLSKTRRSS